MHASRQCAHLRATSDGRVPVSGGEGGGALAGQTPSCPATQPPSHPASHLVTQPPNRLATILCWALHFCLVAPNAVAYIATSQKGMDCTPRDPKCGRFLFIFLDFGQISPQTFLASRGQLRRGGGGGLQPAQPRLGTPPMLAPALKRWGPPTRQGLCSHLAHLWATSDSAPRSEAVGTP